VPTQSDAKATPGMASAADSASTSALGAKRCLPLPAKAVPRLGRARREDWSGVEWVMLVFGFGFGFGV
jgi:hypothetical protein